MVTIPAEFSIKINTIDLSQCHQGLFIPSSYNEVIFNLQYTLYYSKSLLSFGIQMKQSINNLKQDRHFITNRKLLQNVSNNSSSRHHPHTVSLLTKKNYSYFQTMPNEDTNNVEYQQQFKYKIAKVLKACQEQIDKNSKMQKKIDKILLQLDNLNLSNQPKKQNQDINVQKLLILKLQQAFKDKTALRIENEQLKLQIHDFQSHFLKLEKKKKKESFGEKGYRGSEKALQSLVINQSLIIDKQQQQKDSWKEQMAQMMRVQALKIQQMMNQRRKKQRFDLISFSSRNLRKYSEND